MKTSKFDLITYRIPLFGKLRSTLQTTSAESAVVCIAQKVNIAFEKFRSNAEYTFRAINFFFNNQLLTKCHRSDY